jgi:hypothetical protein
VTGPGPLPATSGAIAAWVLLATPLDPNKYSVAITANWMTAVSVDKGVDSFNVKFYALAAIARRRRAKRFSLRLDPDRTLIQGRSYTCTKVTLDR